MENKNMADRTQPVWPLLMLFGLAVAVVILIFYAATNTGQVDFSDQEQLTPGTTPSVVKCNTAIKLLEQYERLAQNLGIKLSNNTLQKLNALRDAGTITSEDLPGGFKSRFPGEFKGQTLKELREICSKQKG